MKRSKRSVQGISSVVACGSLAGFLCLGAAARPQQSQSKTEARAERVHLIPSLDGAELFHAYCAPCHGADATGTGPVAPALSSRPSDLTSLARRNGGIFPAGRVKNLIAGDDLVIAHGSREMPIWGPIFHQIEADRDYGNVRLANITRYIESIQKKL
jgi:hypothetical protein